MKYEGTLIVVKDCRKALQFYRNMFGFELLWDNDGNMILSDGLVLQEEKYWRGFTGKNVIPRNNACELYFEEENVDAFYEKLKTLYPETAFVNLPMTHSWGQQVVRFYDPDGNLIEVGTPMQLRDPCTTEKQPVITIEYVTGENKAFWFQLDAHLREDEFAKKVRDKQGYVLYENGVPKGILRYNLFWDNTPFCTLLFVEASSRKKGYGKKLMEFWENDVKSQGYGMVMTSTQVNEDAQHFYRKLGYKDCGGFTVNIPGYEQPMEMIMNKALQRADKEKN